MYPIVFLALATIASALRRKPNFQVFEKCITDKILRTMLKEQTTLQY